MWFAQIRRYAHRVPCLRQAGAMGCCRTAHRCPPEPVEGWQRNYWDRIIRGDGAYERIARYIHNNPMNWERDRFGNNAGRFPRAG